MSKPLGYYTNHTPGEETLLATLQDSYGAAFDKISKREITGYSHRFGITHWLSVRR